MTRFRFLILVGFCAGCGLLSAAQTTQSFRDCKTIFQTNTSFDPRLAIAVDGVVVHRHAASFAGELDSWRKQGFAVGRMFFADSDAGNAYWTGKWDGTEYPQDVERDREGNVVKCAGVRPYMLPTDGWIRYLQQMTEQSLRAGAGAILPEEPLAHVFTGYEESFKALWQKRYDRPWQGQHESAEARFLTAQLKNELYIELERRLLDTTKKNPGPDGRTPGFILPIHSIYSNIAAQLVAPLGTSTDLPGIDGYIGQIWTGPVNWALGHYDSPSKSFFGSAFVLYDFFTQLAVGSERKMWLLIDPVEDNPDHTWAEFEQWYKHGVAAMLMMKDTDRYEIMPWPDRIFLPGYGTGGKTPAPEDYRVVILSVTQVLQEVPLGGQWETTGDAAIGEGVGVAMADTLMWQRHSGPWLQGAYGMLLPLVERGIPVSSVVLERVKEPEYLKRFKVIVLCYEDFKPTESWMNDSLTMWVKGGGSLIVLGKDGDELDRCENFWWHKQGFASPLAHLLSLLGGTKESSWKSGSGLVTRSEISPRTFGTAAAEKEYLPLIETAWKQTTGTSLSLSGNLVMRRGPFVIARAETKPVKLSGRLLDIFDPSMNIRDGIELTPGQSGLYRDVQADLAAGTPKVLHATHRLVNQSTDSSVLRFVIRGPAETPAVVRILWLRDQPLAISATDPEGKPVAVSLDRDTETALIRFANHPQGVTVSCSTK
ncbi:MAG: hypothetical protein GX455_14120 [Phycisphaerae bacterium]|nr:hypothetical protein [Phycisphaerae bacterium]